MRYQVLGPLEVTDGCTVAALGPPKQRALLAVLLMHAGELVTTDRLIDLLWTERAPRSAAHSVQIYVSGLRKILLPLAGQDVIRTQRSAYLLDADPETIDAGRFERLVDDGSRDLERDDPLAAASSLRAALGLWRGVPLSDFADEAFARPHITRLTGRHLDATELLASAELALGHVRSVVDLVETTIRSEPFRERSRELLMLALYRSGRHPEALRTYQRFRELLADELGLDPSPALQRLQERILLHDPTLSTSMSTSTAVGGTRNPYKGLRPFGEADAADFFGRDALTATLLDRLRAGARLLALVGPSGSGKSSVVAAGVLPALREDAVPGSAAWTIRTVVPGVGVPTEADRLLPARPELLVVDQFEEVFTWTDAGARRRVLEAITAAVTGPDTGTRVVLTLRADFYDRPLHHPGFAEVFTPAVVNVLPMTALELETAAVGPAALVGIDLEPRLVTEVVADAADAPGALPLLQFALAELFERRVGGVLRAVDYRDIGGVRGALSRRAESLYAELDGDRQYAATQLFLRLVRLGQGTRDARRRVPVAELHGIDAVDLSALLDRFGRQRLLSFDRDPRTGEGTVELAHESLLWHWERLAGWIDQHRDALRRHEALVRDLEDWEAADRHPDFLPTGRRLEEFAAKSRNGVLRLTRREREFLDAALDRGRREQDDAARQSAERAGLQRRARGRLRALLVTVVLLGVAATFGVVRASSGTSSPPRVALVFHDSGTEIDRVAENGFDRAVQDFGLSGTRYGSDMPTLADTLRTVSQDGEQLILEFAVDSRVDEVAADFPDTRYVVANHLGDQPNVAYLVWAEQEGSFLAGVAAALTSTTGTIGFLGGVDNEVIRRFRAGYEAGALAARPDIHILSAYVSRPPDLDGFVDFEGAERAARTMYGNGADVVFAAAGSAGLGALEAAADMSGGPNGQLWAIGVDTDQYETTRDLAGSLGAQRWRPHILTSMVKSFDVGIYAVLRDFARGEFTPGRHDLDLASGSVDISYSGGFIDQLRPQIEAYREAIINGDIQVPDS